MQRMTRKACALSQPLRLRHICVIHCLLRCRSKSRSDLTLVAQHNLPGVQRPNQRLTMDECFRILRSTILNWTSAARNPVGAANRSKYHHFPHLHLQHCKCDTDAAAAPTAKREVAVCEAIPYSILGPAPGEEP